ncbi:MAG: type I-E CRISPR-associated protein Cse1/CasA [Oscillospiraceae bacterium]|jgi:CRISPR system Cascade subunit CasA|nr:type I-E CRISPR-associated protein Cse1/CasA [Oscillospiraceae bacterium]
MKNANRFNLLDEPWILVLDTQGKQQKLSLKQIFSQASELSTLANELPTVDVSILRLLLAIMHRALVPTKLPSFEAALDLWKKQWTEGLDVGTILAYLEEQRDAFWLIGDKPFKQVHVENHGTPYDAAKLHGSISQSGGKARLFNQINGADKQELNADLAARMLLHYIDYGDSAAKFVANDKLIDGNIIGGVKVSHTSQFGAVIPKGETLEKTLLLNFVLADAANGWTLWETRLPVWELPAVAKRTMIAADSNSQADLLTTLWRKVELTWNDSNKCTGFVFHYDTPKSVLLRSETMAGVKSTKATAAKPPELSYVQFHSNRAVWRDFGSLFVKEDLKESAKCLLWLAELDHYELINANTLNIQTVGIDYGAMMSAIDEIYSDSIEVNAAILQDMGNSWAPRISDLVAITDKAVSAIGYLAVMLAEACGASKPGGGKSDPKIDGKRDSAKAEAYNTLDPKFRGWLIQIDENTKMTEKLDEWKSIVKDTLTDIAGDLIESCGSGAITGRNGMTSAVAESKFRAALHKALYGDSKKTKNNATEVDDGY